MEEGRRRKEGRTNEGEARAGRKKPRSADTRGISFKTGGGLREEGEEARRKEGEGGLPKSPEKGERRKEEGRKKKGEGRSKKLIYRRLDILWILSL